MKIKGKTIAIWLFTILVFISSFTVIGKDFGQFLGMFAVAVLLGFWGWKSYQKDKVVSTEIKNLMSIQHIVIPSLPSNMNATLNQVKQAINIYVSGYEKIYNDCERLVNTTTTTKVFFERKDLLLEKLNGLVKIEHALNIDPLPSEILSNFNSSYSKTTNDFLARKWEQTLEKANLLTTDKGKATKIEKFFREIAPYQDQMTNQSRDYFQSLKEAYINDMDYISKVKSLEDL